MPLALDTRRRLPAALQSLLQREFDQAIRRLDQAAGNKPTDRVTGVHEFRRSVKRLRAALMLMDGVVPEPELRAIDRALGDAARRLGSLRDAHARRIAAERIVKLVPKSMRALAMDAWRTSGGSVAEAAAGLSNAAAQALVHASRAEIESIRERVRALDMSRLDAGAVADALARAWGRARDRFRASWTGRDEAWLHGVRKRAQRMANLLLLVAPAAGAWAVRIEARLRKASALLGEARDAELMVQAMPALPAGNPLQVPAHRLRMAARQHRVKCLRLARVQGAAAMREGRGEVRKRLRKALDPAR